VISISDFVVKKRNSKSGERTAGESVLEITANRETQICAASGDVSIGIYPKDCEDFPFLNSPHTLIGTRGIFFAG